MVTSRVSTYVIIWLTTWLVMCIASLGRKIRQIILCRIWLEGLMKHFSIFGYARSKMSDAELRNMDMEVRHWSKRLHLGSRITSLEFCPSERVVLTTSKEWGVMATKLTVPADWKDWQVYLLLLGLFLASLVAFYIFFENSDSFWNFPVPGQGARPYIETVVEDAHIGQNMMDIDEL